MSREVLSNPRSALHTGSTVALVPLLWLLQPQGPSVEQSPESSILHPPGSLTEPLPHLPDVRLQSCPLPAAWNLCRAPSSLWSKKYVVCADCECPQLVEGAGWNPTPSHHSHCQAVMRNAVPPSPALATLHLLPWSSSYPMSKFGFLAACRPARSPSFTRARSVNDCTEGSGLRDILLKAKHPLGSLPHQLACTWPSQTL